MRIPNTACELGARILGCPHTLSSDLGSRSTELSLFGSVNEALSEGPRALAVSGLQDPWYSSDSEC